MIEFNVFFFNINTFFIINIFLFKYYIELLSSRFKKCLYFRERFVFK